MGMKNYYVLKAFLILIIIGTGSVNSWGQTVVTYTISAKNTLTTAGTAPSGSTASLVETYTTSKQMTANNSQTLTLTGYSGYKITSITLLMRSNTSTGS